MCACPIGWPLGCSPLQDNNSVKFLCWKRETCGRVVLGHFPTVLQRGKVGIALFLTKRYDRKEAGPRRPCMQAPRMACDQRNVVDVQ